MLGKLYKHELAALGRILLPVSLCLLGISAVSRIVGLLNLRFTYFQVMKFFVYAVSYIGMFGVCLLALIIVIDRFYKNMMTREGYLTFTLPFTATQHLFCKLICGVIAILFALLVAFLSGVILNVGKDLSNFFGAFFSSYGKLYREIGAHAAAYTVFLIADIILGISCAIQHFYTAMALGQSFHKSKIGGAVLWYFIISLALQLLGSLLLPLLYTVFPNGLSVFNDISVVGAVYLSFASVFVSEAVLNVAYFFITRSILTHRLNLE